MFTVSVLGATGYTARELLKLLAHHPHLALAHATTTSRAGQSLSEAHPALRGLVDVTLEPFDAAAIAADSDLVFSCLPHKESMAAVAAVLRADPNIKAVDLSGDFRFQDAGDYAAAYGVPHAAPELLKASTYGLPELFRPNIPKARVVANPGCYPTATLLPLAPLAEAGLLVGDIIVDAKSGVSGAGATPSATTHYVEANESTKPYSPFTHRHQPEMEEQLRTLGSSASIQFVPHLTPMARGILSSIYVSLPQASTTARLLQILSEAYASEPFIRVLPAGMLPETKNTVDSNFCDIGVSVAPNGRRALIASAIDNLVKGASGQALQNANLLLGLPETEGLIARVPTARKPQLVDTK